MASDAQILINANAAVAVQPSETVSNTDTESVFKYYDGSHYKTYLGCLALIILVLLSSIIGVSIGHQSSTKPADDDALLLEGYDPDIEFDGTYRLSSYDQHFDAYLKSLDIPNFAITLIKASKEMITVTAPTHINPNWTLTMRTGDEQAASH